MITTDASMAQVHDGVMYAETESEGKRRRYQVDTVSLLRLPLTFPAPR